MKIKKTALIGMGAIGTVYGKLLHDRFGDNFKVIAGKSRKERLQKSGFTLNGETFYPQIVSVGDEENFDLIIFCVKNYQLEEALEDVKTFVGDNTILITFLNGVTARDRISKAFPRNKALYGLSMKIDAIRTEEGIVNTVNGEIHFGEADNTVISPEVKAVQECFNEAGIENIVFPDMIRMIWKKFMLNVGVNQVTAVTRAPYGKVTHVKTNLVLFREAMKEVLAIAKAQNIDLREEDVEEFVTLMSNFSPMGKTSMLQDIEAKRKTEVDYFAGTVIEMGNKLNIPTPVNFVLYNIIKSLEEMY
ncbi:MAG TPA: ketopantoate reductase family protein [Tissierellia bacterium]|nr:ketopantoate reductase family protein [Tissierellia bacterium]